MKVTATARRTGSWWAIEVPEVPGAFTQAKRLDQVPEAAASAIADLLEIDKSEVEVEVEPVLARPMLDAIETASDLSQAASEAQEAAWLAMRIAVTALRREAGLTTRDAATLLGVSHQRVAQIEQERSRVRTLDLIRERRADPVFLDRLRRRHEKERALYEQLGDTLLSSSDAPRSLARRVELAREHEEAGETASDD